MILLVMLTVITIWTDSSYNSMINFVVWLVFFVDFVIRLLITREKWNFIKSNPFIIIAIIPFDQFFQVARIVRVIYFFRIKTIAKYYITPYVKKVSFQSMLLIILALVLLLMGESILIWKLEGSIHTFFNALYVVFGHLLFFGRQTFIIDHPSSIWLLTATSFLGIGIQGFALQWLFTKVDGILRVIKEKRDTSKAS